MSGHLEVGAVLRPDNVLVVGGVEMGTVHPGLAAQIRANAVAGVSFENLGCTNDDECAAGIHVHGCPKDEGAYAVCDDPERHI